MREEAAAEEGIPLGVKDLFDTAGLVTTYGSPIYADHVPERSAEAVRLLEDAGYAIVGKTNLHEFAYGVTSENPHFGPVRNPHDPSRIAGGSSGGSAAGLAAGMCDAALGSDTGGSIRLPAAFCGVVGFKPTYGAVSLDGCFPLAPSFDHAGPMGRTVRDCAEAWTALTDRPVPAAPDPAQLRVGVAESFFAVCDPGVEEAVRRAVAALPVASEIDFPPPDAYDYRTVFFPEAAAVHRATFPSRQAEYGDDVAGRLALGFEISAVAYLAAQDDLISYRALCATAFAGCDLIAVPTVPCVAPPLGTSKLDCGGRTWTLRDLLSRNTRPFNSLGWPVLALPCGPAEHGLPASISLVGRPGDDELVLAAGAAIEGRLSLV